MEKSLSTISKSPNKERFNARFIIWVPFFLGLFHFMWKEVIIVRFWREKIRYEEGREGNLMLCPCHHKLLIAVMKRGGRIFSAGRLQQFNIIYYTDHPPHPAPPSEQKYYITNTNFFNYNMFTDF